MALRARCITSATQVWRYCVVGCSAACGMATGGFHSYQSDCLCEPLIEITIATTKLDKRQNLHSLDSIATETYGTHGRSIRVHPSEVGLLDSSVPHHSLLDRVGPLGTGVARNLVTEPCYPVQI